MSLLVVSAWEPELERFRALAPSDLTSGVEVRAEALGIGLVAATAGMTRCVMRHAPERVVFLGTGGAAPTAGLAIGDVVVARDVQLADAATLEGRAAMPYASGLALDVAWCERFVIAGAKPVTIATTLAVTTNDALARALAAAGQVEHLEAYGVARACADVSIPCAIVLGIANVVGAAGREEWRANHVLASARAAEVAIRALR